MKPRYKTDSDLPSVDSLDLIWPQPQRVTAALVAKEGLKTLAVIGIILLAVNTQMVFDYHSQLEAARYELHKAEAKVVTLMNGRPLVDTANDIAYIPEGKVIATKLGQSK